MSEEFEKLGRKRSNDPAQESLRQAKDTWNQEVKSLIAGLIAFKRGMNGRGDPRANLPPSSIKDPLPPQIGQYLNGIATQYSKIVDDAKKIIDAQAYYSNNRRKSKPKSEQPQVTAAIIEPSLIAQGSWWGSRAWAYFALLKKIDKHNRKLRLNMLGSGLTLRKGLKHFEYRLAERDANSAPAALTILSGVSSEYVAVFLRMYDKLKEIYATQKAIEPPSDGKQKSAPSNTEQTKAPTPTPEEATPPSSGPDTIPDTQTVSPDLWEEFKKVYDQQVKMEVVLKHIFTLPNADKSNFTTMKRSFSKFLKDVAILQDLSGRSDHDKSAVELEKLTQDVINQYKYLLQTAVGVLGPAGSFDELANRIPKPKVSELLQIMQDHEVIKKEAASSVSNWLNKMWMNINPDNIDRMKLEMIDSTPTIRQSLDSLMDSLENREVGMDEISKKISDVSKKFVDLLDQGIALAKNYMIAARRQEKGKNYYLADIKLTDIRMLNELKSEISEYIK